MVPKLTSNGRKLILGAMNGNGIVFSKIVIGNGDVPDDYTSLTQLQNELASMEISEFSTHDRYAIIKASMSNSDFEDGFYWTELGVYAQDPDGGEDVLYAYAHYKLSGDSAATFIPASTTNIVEITHIVHVFIEELENVSAVLLESAEYVNTRTFNDHIQSTNPHGVTAEDVGLGLVENARSGDLRPEFSNADSGTVKDKNGIISFPNIFNGERFSVILRKIRTAFTAVLQHMSARNPHNIDPETIGASPATHAHSATDINKGVLSIGRGGTGCTSVAELRRELGIQSGSGTITGIKGQAVTLTVYFPQPYTSTPRVVLTPKTDILSTDIYLSVQFTRVNAFDVRLYSESLNSDIAFNWIAIP